MATLGFSTQGGSAGSIALVASDSCRRRGNPWTMPQAGNATAIKAYLHAQGAGSETVDVFAAINQEDSVSAGQHGEVASRENAGATLGGIAVHTFTLAAPAALTAGTAYVLNIVADGNDLAALNVAVRYDLDTVDEYFNSGYGSDYSVVTGARSDPFVDVATSGGSNPKYSIWVEYTPAAIGLATESDGAHGHQRSKAKGLAGASGADQALAVAAIRSATMAPAGEVDSAFGLSHARSAAVATGGEQDLALGLGSAVSAGVGVAAETDVAAGATAARSRVTAPAAELDQSLATARGKLASLQLASGSHQALALVAVDMALLPPLAVDIGDVVRTVTISDPARAAIVH